MGKNDGKKMADYIFVLQKEPATEEVQSLTNLRKQLREIQSQIKEEWGVEGHQDTEKRRQQEAFNLAAGLVIPWLTAYIKKTSASAEDQHTVDDEMKKAIADYNKGQTKIVLDAVDKKLEELREMKASQIKG